MEPEKRKPLLVPAPAQLGILCRPRILAHAEDSGPKDTPEKPKPGGHCLILELPVGGGSAKAKPPRVFPFWKLGTSLFMTFSRGGERGTSWVYGSDTICVMTSAPTRPLSSVNSWEGPGWAWNAGCKGGWAWLGEGACSSQDPVCWPSEGPVRSSHGQAGAGMTRFLGTKEAMTLPAAAALIPGSPRERDRGCWAKKACCSCPHSGAAPCRRLDLA